MPFFSFYIINVDNNMIGNFKFRMQRDVWRKTPKKSWVVTKD